MLLNDLLAGPICHCTRLCQIAIFHATVAVASTGVTWLSAVPQAIIVQNPNRENEHQKEEFGVSHHSELFETIT